MDCSVGQLHPRQYGDATGSDPTTAEEIVEPVCAEIRLDSMKSGSARLAFATAALTCALVWAASPWFTGRREPWDADPSFYLTGPMIAGAVTGALTPKPIWALYLGAIAGQLSYQLLFLKVGPLLPLGVLFLVGYCFVFLATAVLVGCIRTRLQTM